MPPEYTLSELADLAKVSHRTVRYYVEQGLLEGPVTSGPGARYSEDSLGRLLLIRKLAAEHLPLAVVRARLGQMSPGELRSAAPAPASALDYIRSIKGEPAQPAAQLLPPASSTGSVASGPSIPASSRAAPPAAEQRAQWDRFTLSPDVELHVRRPLTRETARAIRELIQRAQELFEGERT